jgi:[CysO sulfur-carrier protein]-S-L-cysteine hydrolase
LAVLSQRDSGPVRCKTKAMKIKKDVIEYILAHAEKDAPIETCGYLMGSSDLIERAIAITNAEGREDHFTFDPKEQFEAYKTARELGAEILGAYHSHPAAPARPSAEDVRLAFDPAILYVIASLMEGERAVKAFRIREGNVAEEPLIVEP